MQICFVICLINVYTAHQAALLVSGDPIKPPTSPASSPTSTRASESHSPSARSEATSFSPRAFVSHSPSAASARSEPAFLPIQVPKKLPSKLQKESTAAPLLPEKIKV